MSHLHIPDGVLPLWLVATGWIITGMILSFCIHRLKKFELMRKIPLIGIVSALMIVTMTLPIIPFAYHINLSVVAGIILGPALAFISVFIVDLIISMFGHGGITVVGLNTLVVGSEAVVGFYLFRFFKSLLGNNAVGWSSGIAAVLSLILSTSILIGVVYASQMNPEIIVETQDHEHDSDSAHGEEPPAINHKANLKGFVKTIIALLAFGWILEGTVTGLVVNYVSGLRPDIISPEDNGG